MTGHTKTPWTHDSNGRILIKDASSILPHLKINNAWQEGSMEDDPEALANAAFIVRACNSHSALASALAGLLIVVPNSVKEDIQGHIEAAQAALKLAKAKG